MMVEDHDFITGINIFDYHHNDQYALLLSQEPNILYFTEEINLSLFLPPEPMCWTTVNLLILSREPKILYFTYKNNSPLFYHQDECAGHYPRSKYVLLSSPSPYKLTLTLFSVLKEVFL